MMPGRTKMMSTTLAASEIEMQYSIKYLIMKAVKHHRHKLKFTCSGTSSQWRSTSISCLRLRSNFLVSLPRCAAAFKRRCNLSFVVFGRPPAEHYTVWVKKIHPTVFWNFFPNVWEFLTNFLHAYYTNISILDYKFLFNYLQLWRSYAILSATTQRIFTFH